MTIIRAFLLNLQFFTSIPVKRNIPIDPPHMTSAISMFPLLGLFQGTLTSTLLLMLLEWTPLSPLAIAFLVWLFWILLTGGIHLDGWMDTSDAFFSYRDKEKRLEIMSDPRTGAFGVLSAIVLLSGRFLFLYEVVAGGITPVDAVLIAMIPCVSRSVMGAILVAAPLAKQEGLAFYFQTNTRPVAIRYIILMVLLMIIGLSLLEPSLMVSLIGYALLGVGVFSFVKDKSVAWFGGITGDVLGATGEGTEWLLWMMLWLLHYAAMA